MLRALLRSLWSSEAVVGGAIALSLVAVWILPTVFAAILGDAELFQRLGATAMVWAIVFFTLSRKSVSELIEFIQFGERLPPASEIEALNKPEEIQKVRKVLDTVPIARRLIAGFVGFEVFIFSLGTIQSSFGDWFICSLSDWSFSRC